MITSIFIPKNIIYILKAELVMIAVSMSDPFKANPFAYDPNETNLQSIKPTASKLNWPK